MLDVHGLPLLLAESFRVARAVDNRAEQVEALTTLGLATPVLAEGRAAAILASVFVPIVFANALATTLLALILILAMLANSFATTLLAMILLFAMRAHRTATTLNTTLPPLQMHTHDSRHSGRRFAPRRSRLRADFKEREEHNTPLFEPISLICIELTSARCSRTM